jgi:phosphatidylserine synthase
VYVACALTRLARYNVTHNADPQGFVGVPTPVAALVWSSVLVLGTSPIGASVVAVALGLAMVAPLPLSRPGPAGLTLFALWPMALMVVHLAHA